MDALQELLQRSRQTDAVVFDVGNVLIRYDPPHIARTLLPENHRQALAEAMFTPGEWYWGRFDEGLVPDEEAAERIACRAGLPGCGGEVLHALYHFHEDRVPLPLAQALPAFRKTGKKLVALTNYNEKAFGLLRDRFDFFRCFDGVVVSGEEKLWKPMPAFYRLALERYGLTPGRTLMIDDREENTAAAAALGMQIWLYPVPDAD